MSWARVAIAVIIALPVGAVAGSVLASRQVSPRLGELSAEKAALQDKFAKLEDKVKELQGLADSLERDKRHLQDQLASSKKPDDASAALEAVGDPKDTTMTDPPQDANASANQDRRRGPDPNETEEQRLAREQERAQRGQEFRDRIRNFMDEQIQNAPDKATQDRLAAMNEYSETMMDLFQQMRNAKTDEERDAIRQQLQDNGQQARQLMQEQQDYMLRDSLKQNGVTDTKAQDAMMQSIKQTMESPFFRGPMGGFGGGGFGGPGGPPGGFGGFGGGRTRGGGDRGGTGGGPGGGGQ